MATERAIARYQKLYAGLLRLYPEPFRRRFSGGMAQTFNDLCRDRMEAGQGLSGFMMATFGETLTGVIRERITFIMQKRGLVHIVLATASILLLPLLAMQFTDAVSWDAADFAVAGVLLFGAGLVYLRITGRAGSMEYRVAAGMAVLAALSLVWVNLAVGLLGPKENPAELMYLGVLAVGVIGAIAARLRPRGMARAMFATALAQALVPALALVLLSSPGLSWEALQRVLGLNALFVVLFVGSAMLFRRATVRMPTQDG